MPSYKPKPPTRVGSVAYDGSNETDKIKASINYSLGKFTTVRVSTNCIHEALRNEGIDEVSAAVMQHWLKRICGNDFNYSMSPFGDEYSFTERL